MNKESFCLKCGCKIDGPGICAGCAEVTTEVAFPVFVRQVITKAQKAQSLALARIQVADELFNGTAWSVANHVPVIEPPPKH